MATANQRRNLTPPQIAEQFGVSVRKVIEWIRSGELAAMNLARKGCDRPRYSVTPEALNAFERLRAVVPEDTQPRIGRLRRTDKEIKEFV